MVTSQNKRYQHSSQYRRDCLLRGEHAHTVSDEYITGRGRASACEGPIKVAGVLQCMIRAQQQIRTHRLPRTVSATI